MTWFKRHKPSFPEAAALEAWFKTALGQRLLEVEHNCLSEVLTRRFGYHLLQLGKAAIPLHHCSPVGHKFLLTEQCLHDGLNADGVALPEALPLASETMDVVVLHHVLDYSHYQHEVLREVSRVLIAGGQLVILGFNPYSCWGLRALLSWQKQAPWQANMLSPVRLTDWLKLLGFQVEQIRFGMYSLPFNSRRCIRYHAPLDRLVSRLNWPTGGIYMISARKQLAPLTPIQRRWFRLPGNVGMPIAKKIGGSKQHHNTTALNDQEPTCRK